VTELRDADAIEAWMSFGLLFACLGTNTRTGTKGGAPTQETHTYFNTVLAERSGMPPPGCVIDLAMLLMDDARAPHPRVLPDEPRLRSALREWEDQVLGRIRGDRRLRAIQDAVAALPSPLRAEAAGLFASVVLGRIGAHGLQVVPGVVRRALANPQPRAATQETLDLLTEGYADLVRRARAVPELIAPSDVFLLTWMERLRGLEARVGLEQIAAVAAKTPLPTQLKSRRQAGQALSRLDEDSAFPVGGFSSIQTSGAIENIVSSELAYMNPPTGALAEEIDLFDLRWAEGELLYYSRDEGTHHRERRALLIDLQPELDHERDPTSTGAPQRLVQVLGRMVAVLRKLTELLGQVGLQIHISAPISREGAPLLALELTLLGLLLHDLSERGVLTMGHASSDRAEAWLAAARLRGVAERLVVGAGRQNLDDMPAPETFYMDADTDVAMLLQQLV
jgi:hypothetical protein